jgi:tetratricopeptide (TPR) repeat protein
MAVVAYNNVMVGRWFVAGMLGCVCAFAPHCVASSLILNGKVIMENGSAPGRAVSIERVCAGDKPEHIADTNAKGEYMWRATANRATTDFNHLTNGSLGATVFANTPREICTIRATMPGYESTQLEVQDVTALDNPVLPTLTLMPRGSQIDLETSQVSVPRNAASAWNRADKEIRRKNWPGAEEQLRAVVAAAPKFARGWEMLGNVFQFDKKPKEARDAYQNAVTNDPRRLPVYLLLARAEIDAHDWDATRQTAAALVKADLKKEYPEAYVYQAIAAYNLNDLNNAAASAEEAIRVDKKHNVPRAEYVYGLILQARQDNSGAREHLSRFLELDPHALEAESARSFLSGIDHPQVSEARPIDVSVALQGVAESLTLAKSSEAWVPGGVAALSAIAHLERTPSPQDFFTEFCRTMAGEGSPGILQGIPLYNTTLREYMAIIAELSRMGDRHGDSVTIQLSLTGAERERTERILQSVGWRVTKSGSGVRVIPGDHPSDSTRLEVLPALGVDAVAMQQALQDGKTFSFEITSEQVRLFGGNSWVALLKDPGMPGGIAAAFTLDIRLAQTYAALSAMEPEAATALADGVGLRNLVTRYSGTAIHFANAFTVSGHVAAVPGGKDAESIWQGLVGAKPHDPSAFFKAVLIKDEGRFANFYWLLSQADAAHQKFFLKDAAKFYAWFRDTGASREGVRRMENPWRATFFHDLPLDDTGNVRFPGGRGAWVEAASKSPSSKTDDSLLGLAALEALVPVANLETKRKSPLDETSARLLSRHYSEWHALFPMFERLPALTGEDFQALERLGESTRTMPRPQQNTVMAEWHALVELMMLGVDAGERVDPGMFRAICSRLASADSSAQAVALLREMAGDGDLDQVVPARFLHLSGDRLAGFHRVMTFQHVPHLANVKGGPETAAALSGLVYAATLDSNGLLVTEDARFLAKHRFAETGLFAEPALVKSSQAPGSYLTGGLMNLSAFGKNLTSGGRPPAIEATPPPVPTAATTVAGPAPAPAADVESQPADTIFRADSRLVEVFATVTDSGGHYVDDLTADRFAILDSG